MSRVLYVAGPMTSLPEFNYPAFHQAADDLRGAGFVVLNPAENERPIDSAWDLFMRDALKMVSDADGVAVLYGWETSRGAQLEVHVAHALRMPVLAVSAWLDQVALRSSFAGPGSLPMVGRCGEMLLSSGVEPPLICELGAGHTGMHRTGQAEWLRPCPRADNGWKCSLLKGHAGAHQAVQA